MAKRDKPEVSFTRLDALLTLEEVAAHLKVCEKTIRTWIKSGDLDAIDLNRGQKKTRIHRVRESVLEQFVLRCENPRKQARPSTPRRPAPKRHF